MIERYSRPGMRAVWDPEARIGNILEIEVALLEVIARSKKIPRREIAALRALRGRGPYARAVAAKEKKSAHDVVALLQVISGRLKGRAPKVVQYLHYGLTSSDVVDTATAMQARAAGEILIGGWRAAITAIRAQARRHRATWMVGRTHGVHAEPLPFGLKLAGWHAEARRCLARLEAAHAGMLYGKLSGAVGTYAHHTPATERAVLRKLGLKPEPVATQVIPRDRYADFFAALAMSAAAIERFATEIRHLQRTEVREVEEPFGKGQKGSSAMPHKRNPVLCENLTGLARVVRGFLVPALENNALWHERDISHSAVERVALPDATILLDFMLARFTRVVSGMLVYPENMKRNLERSNGLAFSQKILLALIDKGLGRLAAYDIVQRNAMTCWRTGEHLRELLGRDPDVRARMSAREIARCFDLAAYGKQIAGVLKREGIL